MDHMEFIRRFGRLGPREIIAPPRLEGTEMQAMTCEKLAASLLHRDIINSDGRSKFEVGRTKIFIRFGIHWCCLRWH